MEISKNPKRLSKPENEETEKPLSGRRRKVMIALWHKLTIYWPHWESINGDVNGQPIYTWQSSLNKFSEEDLKGALDMCEDWTGQYPPNFPEFKQLCRAAQSNNRARMAVQPPNLEVKSLEAIGKAQRTDTEAIRRHKEKYRRMLAGEDVETVEESKRVLGIENG